MIKAGIRISEEMERGFLKWLGKRIAIAILGGLCCWAAVDILGLVS